MAYRELGMIEVREVPRCFKYIAACVAAGLCPGCTLPTDAPRWPRSSRRSGRPTSGGRGAR